jgi:hypothetical protein
LRALGLYQNVGELLKRMHPCQTFGKEDETRAFDGLQNVSASMFMQKIKG